MKQKDILVSCFSRWEHLYKTIQAYIYCMSFETGIITEDMYPILDGRSNGTPYDLCATSLRSFLFETFCCLLVICPPL